MKPSGSRKRSRPHHHADPVLVTRVKKYLAENVDKTFVDVAAMGRALKDRHRNEYARLTDVAFKRAVEVAYGRVLRDYDVDAPHPDSGSGSSSSTDDESDDLEVLDPANDRLVDMYNKKDKQPPVENKSGELIDISSDDESNKKDENVENPPPTTSPPPAPPTQQTPRRPSSKKAKAKTPPAKTSEISLDDFGGVAHISEQICDLVLHMRHPEVYSRLGMKAPRGALLHGPPGTGKTLLANAIAGRLKLPIVSVVATELITGVSGDSEKLIRDTFESAVELAPCVLFIDEIDAVCGNRANAQRDMERRVVSQLLACIDSLAEREASVLLLAASNDPDRLDPGLRRAGRLEHEIPLGIPTVDVRADILKILCRNLNKDPDLDLEHFARMTPGFVGADLSALVNRTCTVAVKRAFAQLCLQREQPPAVVVVVVENGADPRVNGETAASKDVEEVTVVADSTAERKETPKATTDTVDVLQKYLDDSCTFTPEQLADVKITRDDMTAALKTTKPCALREGIITVPDTTWDDVGSLVDVRRDLQLAVLAPVKYPRELVALGLTVPGGVLLCGPPGCGKTLLAKAVANEAGVNFISVKGPELLNMYVGESERAVRTCFTRARNSTPCVIFFDEFDSLCPKRNNMDTSGASRVVNQLLTEMDGVEGREGVFILAATNRPDIVDPAVLRPGRLDRVIFVGMPSLDDRVEILQAITKKGTKPPLAEDVELKAIAEAAENFTGADLAGLVRLAATEALTDFITGSDRPEGPLKVTAAHFQVALGKSKPSVSPKDLQHYDKLKMKYGSVKNDKNDVDMDTSECMDTV